MNKFQRYEADIFIEHYGNTNTFACSLVCQGASKWNALSIDERGLLTIEDFKEKQKGRLKNKLLAM